jgi:hypothetical protein
MRTKSFSVLLLLLVLSACQGGGSTGDNNGTGRTQGSVQPNSPEPVQAAGFQACTADIVKEVVGSCLGGNDFLKQKVSEAIAQWAQHDGYWFPEMIETGSFKKRFSLSDEETQCLISKSCKEVSYEN